jgi:hypothetical protein
MTTTLQGAEERVAHLIAETNRIHPDDLAPWAYELTTEVDNIGIAATDAAKTLRINPIWLGFVTQTGDFKACVADEILGWYLLRELTGSF